MKIEQCGPVPNSFSARSNDSVEIGERPPHSCSCGSLCCDGSAHVQCRAHFVYGWTTRRGGPQPYMVPVVVTRRFRSEALCEILPGSHQFGCGRNSPDICRIALVFQYGRCSSWPMIVASWERRLADAVRLFELRMKLCKQARTLRSNLHRRCSTAQTQTLATTRYTLTSGSYDRSGKFPRSNLLSSLIHLFASVKTPE